MIQHGFGTKLMYNHHTESQPHQNVIKHAGLGTK